MEKYIVDGQGYDIEPQDLEIFLQRYPNAEKYEPENVIDPIDESKPEDDSWDWRDIVDTLGKVARSTTPGGYASVISEEAIDDTLVGSNQSTFSTIANIGGEYADALYTGWSTGMVLEENLEVFKGNHSPEAIEAMIKAGERLNSLPQNDRMTKFAKAVEESDWFILSFCDCVKSVCHKAQLHA